MCDPLRRFLVHGTSQDIRAVLVEPIPFYCTKLRNLYADYPNITVLNVACGAVCGRAPLYFVEPSVASLTALVRQVRYAQAYAKNALPVLVTCDPVARELLANQGIPTFVWSADSAAMVPQPAGVVTTRRGAVGAGL